jgi:hypothetical protein
MGSLRQSMEEYLAMRRRLGFKLHEAGLRLKDFVSFMEERRARRITVSVWPRPLTRLARNGNDAAHRSDGGSMDESGEIDGAATGDA